MITKNNKFSIQKLWMVLANLFGTASTFALFYAAIAIYNHDVREMKVTLMSFFVLAMMSVVSLTIHEVLNILIEIKDKK